MVRDVIAFEVQADSLVRHDVGETEYQFFGVFMNLRADTPDFLHQVVNGYIVRKDKRVKTPYDGGFAQPT